MLFSHAEKFFKKFLFLPFAGIKDNFHILLMHRYFLVLKGYSLFATNYIQINIEYFQNIPSTMAIENFFCNAYKDMAQNYL